MQNFLVQLPDIYAHEVQFDTLYDRAVMTEPMALETMEVVVEITSYLHLELVVTVAILFETLHGAHEAAELLYDMLLLILAEFFREVVVMVVALALIYMMRMMSFVVMTTVFTTMMMAV